MVIQRSTIEFEHCGIGTALRRNRLGVPPNQREYSWEEEHVQDLFQDLAGAIETTKSSYFLGTIVLTRGPAGTFEVADGQQRLATTSILLAAIRDYFQDRNEDQLVQSINNDFLIPYVREARDVEPRLRLNVDDNEFFKNKILAEKGDPRRRAPATKPSHNRIALAARLAEQHVQSIIARHNDQNRIEILNQWVSYIEHSALVIVLKVPDDLNAYVMFETLNDRGLRTSQADLVKNHLFSLADDRLTEAQQRWAAMNGALETLEDDEDVTITYLRHSLIARWGHTRQREVFDKVKANIMDKQHAIGFLDFLASQANDYAAIQTPSHSKWTEYHPDIREHVNMMAFLQLTPLRPLMLAVVANFSKRQTEMAFRQFVCWSVRLLVCGGARSGRMEEAVARAAQEVSGARVKTARKLADQMKDVLPTDPVFESRFATETVAKSALARYYLRALESKIQNDPAPEWVPNENIVISLEHVLPQNPGSGWASIDPALLSAYYKRVGNMVLLQAGPNSNIGNKTFDQKKPVLAQSTFKLTSEVANESIWGPEEIEKRQKRLASIALQIWPLRF